MSLVSWIKNLIDPPPQPPGTWGYYHKTVYKSITVTDTASADELEQLITSGWCVRHRIPVDQYMRYILTTLKTDYDHPIGPPTDY